MISPIHLVMREHERKEYSQSLLGSFLKGLEFANLREVIYGGPTPSGCDRPIHEISRKVTQSTVHTQQYMTKRRNAPKEWSPVTLTGGTPDKKEVGWLQTPWQYVISNAAPYPAERFTQIILQLILHPECNSKNIRRANILSDTDMDLDTP